MKRQATDDAMKHRDDTTTRDAASILRGGNARRARCLEDAIKVGKKTIRI